MVPTFISREFTHGLALLLLAVLCGCAGQVPPGGGSVDTTPPTILHTSPDTNAVRVHARAITLEFSEYVQRGSVEGSVFISPYLGDLEFDWSGTEVTIRFQEQLRANTTYVVNIGTDVSDYRAANRMANAFTLAFSTGDSIDRGSVSGRVFDEHPEGVMLFAYRLTGLNPDTLDPSRDKPDYITQTGRNGAFTFSNLSFGPYRVFAIRDEYRNLLYDRQVDQYGVGSGDLRIDERAPQAGDVWFRLGKEDTTRPFLTGVRAKDQRRIAVRFSEAVDSASFAGARFAVVDTARGTLLPLLMRSQDRADPSLATLLTGIPLDSPATYRIRAWGVKDLAGNAIDTTATGELFTGVLAPDTVRPRISLAEMRDSIRDVATGINPELIFSDPVDQAPLARGVVMIDSARAPVNVGVVWTGPASLTLLPHIPLMHKAWYAIRVKMDSVRSLFGKGYRDSTYTIHFQTLDARTTGTLAGSVADARGEGGRGRIYVTASSVDLTPRRTETVALQRPGPFRFGSLVEGKYFVSGFRDADGSGKYSLGLPSPFTPAERFTVYPDTIRVRARWGVEGVVLQFK